MLTFGSVCSGIEAASVAWHPLGRNQGQEACFAFSSKDHCGDAIEGLSLTLRAGGHSQSHANAGVPPAVAYGFQPRIGRNGRGDMGDVVSALTAQAGETGKGDAAPCVALAMRVRRVTPRECERLQGFPDVKKSCRINVINSSNPDVCFSDQQSTNVLAAQKSHKSPSNAYPVEGNECPSHANAVGQSLSASQASSNEPVLVSVRIDLERQHLQLHSAGKLLLSASIAERQEWCRLPILGGDFVLLTAKLLTLLEREAQAGRVESQQSMTCSTLQGSGSRYVAVFGREIAELVADAELFTKAVAECMKFTTSQVAQHSPISASALKTLSCCVVAAITSSIQEGILQQSSFNLEIETVEGWTLVPYRNKPAADGPRYKALGNSMAVPCMRWIGARIWQHLVHLAAS